MARLDDIDLDIKNAVLRANATDREEITRILNYLYRLSAKLKWWQTKLDRGNLTDEERKAYEGLFTEIKRIWQELAEKADKTLATTSQDGLMSTADKEKLDACVTTDATTTTHGLMSANDKYKINRLNNLRIASDDTTPWKTAGGRQASPGIWIVRNQGAVTWAPQQYSSGLAFGEADTHGYMGMGYSNTEEGKVSFAGGSTTNSTDAAPKWCWMLKGTNGKEYNLDDALDNAKDYGTQILDSSAFESSNVMFGSATYRRIGSLITCDFSITTNAAFTDGTAKNIFTLPSGFIPMPFTFTAISSDGVTCEGAVLSGGVVRLTARGGDVANLKGIAGGFTTFVN